MGMQRQTAVTIHFLSEQLSLVVFLRNIFAAHLCDIQTVTGLLPQKSTNVRLDKK